MKIDFFARQEHFVDHLLPVWKALPSNKRGTFYVHVNVVNYCNTVHKWILSYDQILVPEQEGSLHVKVPGNNPIVVCAYGDFLDVHRSNPERIVMLAEHGVGLAFGKNAGYAGGEGKRNKIDCFLSSSEYVARKNLEVFNTPTYIVGVPKMDKYKENSFRNWMRTGSFAIQQTKEKPVVCLSFHWNGSHISPEAGNAFALYGRPDVLEMLKSKFNMIGHCHPKEREVIKPAFEAAGIPFVDNFDDVLQQADIYCNDCSSTMYEFCVTGKPVVVMNAPWFRRDIHYGIRFWDYSDVGKNVNTPKQLVEAIEDAIQNPNRFKQQREKAVRDLYPHLGNSARIFADAVIDFTKQSKKMLQPLSYHKLINLYSGANNDVQGISKNEIKHLCWLAFWSSGIALDIGMNYGKSALCLQSILSTKLHVVTSSKEDFQEAQSQASALGLLNSIVWHWQSSKEVLDNYKISGNKHDISLVFCKEPTDALMWMDHIMPGGYIALHNCDEFHTENRVAMHKIKFSGKFDDFTKVGRIFSARRKP